MIDGIRLQSRCGGLSGIWFLMVVWHKVLIGSICQTGGAPGLFPKTFRE
jgi:hypothetical protein